MYDEYRAVADLSRAHSKEYSHGRAAYGIALEAMKLHTHHSYHEVSDLETAGNPQTAGIGIPGIVSMRQQQVWRMERYGSCGILYPKS